MTPSDVIGEVRKCIEAADSIRSLARDWDVSPSYLCDLRDGRRLPGPQMLEDLGLKKIKTIIYVRVS